MATASHALSETVSRAGAALRLSALTNGGCLSRAHVQAQAERSENRGNHFVLFYRLPVFSPSFHFSFPSFFLLSCLSPAVTRSNPESNGCRSLTLIKGGQLTKGPGVTFIRRLVLGLF